MVVSVTGNTTQGFRIDNAATEATLQEILDFLTSKGVKKGLLKDVEKAADTFKGTATASDLSAIFWITGRKLYFNIL